MKQNDYCCDCACVSKIDGHPWMLLIIGGNRCGRVTIDSKVGGEPAISVVTAEVAWFMESDVLWKSGIWYTVQHDEKLLRIAYLLFVIELRVKSAHSYLGYFVNVKNIINDLNQNWDHWNMNHDMVEVDVMHYRKHRFLRQMHIIVQFAI